MKFKLLTLTALTLAVSAFAHAQTDPYLFGLRAKLPSTEKLKDPRIATLFEVWKNAEGVLQSNGYLEMGFHFPTSTTERSPSPGNEVDMQCFKCAGDGCNICKGTGWIELGGAGMVHPSVLQNCGIDSREYKGFAFGCGIDRMIMLKYGLDDVRSLYNGDLRVVNQF